MIIEKAALENFGTYITSIMYEINNSESKEETMDCRELTGALTVMCTLNIKYEVFYIEGNYAGIEINGKYFAVEDDKEQ